MKLFDVNILIYAHREDQLDHGYYLTRLERVVRETSAFALSSLVAGGFVRIVTHPKFPNGPTPLPHALAVIDNLMHQPNAHWVQPGQRHWELTASLCRETQSQGKSVSDAQHAAIAIEHACTLVSRDTDFRRFQPKGLRFDCWSPESD